MGICSDMEYVDQIGIPPKASLRFFASCGESAAAPERMKRRL